MTVVRKLIRTEEYLGRTLEARYMGPDLLAYVDGVELGNFYIDAQAAIDAGTRYVDQQEKDRAKTAEANKQRRRTQ